MSTNHLELAFRRVERQVLLDLLQDHPEWPLATVLAELQRNERRRWLLEELTVGDLLGARPAHPNPASLAGSIELDEAMLAALADAAGGYTRMSDIAARVPVPRHRLQASLRRLVAAGRVERVGATVQTRYRLVTA